MADTEFDYISFAYAMVLGFGGFFGYVKAGSTISLVSGLLSGALMLYGAYQTSIDADNYIFSLIVSGCLACLMGYRFISSGKFMPAGMVLLLSVGMVVRFAIRFQQQAESRTKRS